MPVAKQISDLVNNPESFTNYQRPPQVIETDDDPEKTREMLKTFALASAIFEDDLAEKRKPPFRHSKEEDLAFLE